MCVCLCVYVCVFQPINESLINTLKVVCVTSETKSGPAHPEQKDWTLQGNWFLIYNSNNQISAALCVRVAGSLETAPSLGEYSLITGPY